MALEYFPCYHSYRKKIAKLSDQEVGRLFRALLEYSETGETQELTGRESIAFDFIADDIDRARETYNAKCEQNKRNRTSTTVDDRGRPSTTVDKTKTKDKDKTKVNIPPKPPSGAFERFWSAYPKKVGKQAALSAYKKVKVPVETLISAVEAQKTSAQWTKDNGQYIPNPATWLNQGRWEDVLDAAAPVADAGFTPGESEIQAVLDLKRMKDEWRA